MVLVIAVVFWAALGQNIPPYSAAMEVNAFAEAFRAKAHLIRVGMVGMIMGGVLYMVWGLAISKVMESIERHNNVLSTLQMWGAGLTTLFFMIPPGIWLTATFRAESTAPETLQLLYDLGWMLFDMTVPVTMVQFAAFGVCVLGDRRRMPVFPKWLGWMALYLAGSFALFALMPFFKAGAFSRSGAVNFWVEFNLFFLFMLLTSVFVLRAITRLEAEHAASHPAS